MNERPTRILLAVVVCLLFVQVFPAQASSNARLDRWFVFGTNLAWFGNNYGCDIGVNHAEGGWQPSFDVQAWEKIFANLEKMGCPVIRIWAFERQEGLLFTRDLTTDPKYPYHEVTGLDPVFMQNCRTIMALAEKHHLKVYWSLLNHLIREEQHGKHLRIITDPKVRASYIKNAAVPFVREFGVHPAFFAVDIINEADGTIGGLDALSGCMDPRSGCSWKQMRVFVKECATAFHAAVPGIKVTCTSGWHGEKNVKAGRFSGLGLDFYDWHSYLNDPVLPHASELGLDKPVIIGECGPKTGKPENGYAFQGRNWRAYFEQARKGYAGILTWSYGNPGADDNMVMINADHSWRDGAKAMFDYAQGRKYPDAGPISYTAVEKAELEAVNAAMKPILEARGNLGVGSRDGNSDPVKPLLMRLATEVNWYYPYLNPKYARLRAQRTAGELADLLSFALRAGSDSAFCDRLRGIGQGFLTQVTAADGLRNLSTMQRLEALLRAESIAPTSSGIGEDLIAPAGTR